VYRNICHIVCNRRLAIAWFRGAVKIFVEEEDRKAHVGTC